MRQESLYRVDAASAAGARGLMQLKPGTAAQVTARLRDSGLDHEDLFDPAVNIRLGAEELAHLLERYDGQLVVALAAYNAGSRAADRWLPDAPIDADVWVENIPYNETRDYVRRVLWHTVVFRWLESGRGQDVKSWLADVHPLADLGA
jgi:soluble lytic murein transglycosylase